MPDHLLNVVRREKVQFNNLYANSCKVSVFNHFKTRKIPKVMIYIYCYLRMYNKQSSIKIFQKFGKKIEKRAHL